MDDLIRLQRALSNLDVVREELVHQKRVTDRALDERDAARSELTRERLKRGAWESVARLALEKLGVRVGFDPVFDDMRAVVRDEIEDLKTRLAEARVERDRLWRERNAAEAECKLLRSEAAE